MYETLYVYYIVPDTNFNTEKETSQNTENLSGPIEKFSTRILSYLPLLLLLLLLYYLIKQSK